MRGELVAYLRRIVRGGDDVAAADVEFVVERERDRLPARGDVEIAIAWLKSIDRWREGITEEQVKAELAAAAAKLEAAT